MRWHKNHYRDFLWRREPTPYHVLVSEILLQKTNAEKVEPAYQKLTRKYPTIRALSRADIADLKKIIQPLGLLYRAERLRLIAQEITTHHAGVVPDNLQKLLELKGVGLYTANAVLCFGYGKRAAIFDTNVERIFFKELGIKSARSRSRTDKQIWETAAAILPHHNVTGYNLALLDYSALVYPGRTKPVCTGLKCRGCIDEKKV